MLITKSVSLSEEQRNHGIANSVLLTEDQWNHEKLRRLFKNYDKDGDNLLNKEELKEAFKYPGAILSGRRASRGLQHADANRDGFINDKELVELVNYAVGLGFTVN